MRNGFGSGRWLLAVVGLVLLPRGVGAQYLLNADQALSERWFAHSVKIPPDRLFFLWEPELPMSTSLHSVVAACERGDGLFPRGDHRVTFSSVVLSGVGSGRSVSLPGKLKVRVKNGLPRSFASRDVTEAVRSTFASDSLVLVEGRVKMTGSADAGDLVSCVLGLMEVDEAVLFSATATGADSSPVLEGLAKRVLIFGRDSSRRPAA